MSDIKKQVVIVGEHGRASKVQDALLAAGIGVDVRDPNKPRQVASPMPKGCVAVVCMITSGYGNAIREAARLSGAEYIGAGSGSAAIRELRMRGVLPKEETDESGKPRYPILLVGDVDDATLDRWEASWKELMPFYVAEIFAPDIEHTAAGRWVGVPPKLGQVIFAMIVVDKCGNGSKEDGDAVEAALGRFSSTLDDGPLAGAIPMLRINSREMDDPTDDKFGRVCMRAMKLVTGRFRDYDKANAPPPPPRKEGKRPRVVFENDKETGLLIKRVDGVKVCNHNVPFKGSADGGSSVNFACSQCLKEKEELEAKKVEAVLPTQEVTPPPAPEVEEEDGDDEDVPRTGLYWQGEEVYSVSTAAGLLDCALGTVQAMVREGRLEAVSINGEPYLLWDEIARAQTMLAPLMDEQSDLAVESARVDGLLDATQSAAYTGCSAGTIHVAVNKGLLSVAKKEGRSRFFTKAALDDWRARRKLQPRMKRRTGITRVPAPYNANQPGAAYQTYTDQKASHPNAVPNDSVSRDSVLEAARFNVKELAARIQVVLGEAGLDSITIAPHGIRWAKRTVTVTEEEVV